MTQDGMWLSILDYATAKKTSISTIRRSIKAGHLKYREENGKYYIWTKEIKTSCLDDKNNFLPNQDFENLKKQNRELVEELNDLKMLLTVYESQNITELPPVPVIEQ